MRNMRRVLTVGATFLLAAATGHLMQNGEAIGARLLGARHIPDSIGTLEVTKVESVANIVVPGPAAAGTRSYSPATPAMLPALPRRLVPEDNGIHRTIPAVDPQHDAFGQGCAAPALTLTPAPGAAIHIDLTAPCHTSAPVSLRHGGIGFGARTDAAGRFTATLPALAQYARVVADLPGGERVQAAITAPGLESVNRVAVSWQAAGDLQLNAYEYGAMFGGAGHVHPAAPRQTGTDLGGYLTALGDASLPVPLRVQIYTAPADMTDIHFALEAPVTTASCNRDLTATTVRALAGTPPDSTALSLSMPECGSPGEAVIMPLPNLPAVSASLSLASAD